MEPPPASHARSPRGRPLQYSGLSLLSADAAPLQVLHVFTAHEQIDMLCYRTYGYAACVCSGLCTCILARVLLCVCARVCVRVCVHCEHPVHHMKY